MRASGMLISTTCCPCRFSGPYSAVRARRPSGDTATSCGMIGPIGSRATSILLGKSMSEMLPPLVGDEQRAFLREHARGQRDPAHRTEKQRSQWTVHQAPASKRDPTLTSTVACPSHASVVTESDHEAGVGVCGASGTSRPSSRARSRRTPLLLKATGSRRDEDLTTDTITPYNGPHTTTRRRVANDFSELPDARDRHPVEFGDDIAAPQPGGVRRSVAHDLFNQNATEPVGPLTDRKNADGRANVRTRSLQNKRIRPLPPPYVLRRTRRNVTLSANATTPTYLHLVVLRFLTKVARRRQECKAALRTKYSPDTEPHTRPHLRDRAQIALFQ